MICWYCHWGWPEPVHEIYQRAVARLNAIPGWGGAHCLENGPAHIVWADENWDAEHLEWCLGECVPKLHWSDYPPAVLDVIRRSLREMLALPTERREVEPEEYEDEGKHPELFPPPAGVKMIASRWRQEK